MCGIAGIIQKNNTVSSEAITLLTDSMTHRGPDASGIFTKYNYAIGHRRLSIIDLSNGRQPMHSEDNNYHITYNGEIYFCGMFAFTIADDNRKRFFIARDYLGIKPVIIYKDSDKVAFASEIQALRNLDSFDSAIDIQAIDQYLAFQYIPAPRTIYQNASKLLPGHYIHISYDMDVSSQYPYYSFSFNSKEKKYSEAGFEDDDQSELNYSEIAARINHTEHHTQVITGDCFKLLPELVKHKETILIRFSIKNI